ncbi:LysM and putative peptidoglycan-binding domain-containing protein 1 [Linum grandiflorum]
MRKEEDEDRDTMIGHCTSHRSYSLFANDYDRRLLNSDDLAFDSYNQNHFFNGNGNENGNAATSVHSSPTTSPVSRRGFIEHSVSKFDTLAGVAIKYGVEVADIKKKNGLVTDHQMFALKTLRIPLPGRHPPSPSLSNGSPCESNCEHTPLQRRYSDLFDSFQSLRPKSSSGRKVSSAMSSLQGYYGLSAGDPSQSLRLSPDSNPPLTHQRKSRSYVNVLLDENNGRDCTDSDSMVRRRQKSEADFPNMLKSEENNGVAVSAGITGKRLSLRTKATNRSGLLTDFETVAGLSPKQATLDSEAVDPVSAAAAVRKSSSTSSLNDTDCAFSWPSPKWSLKADLQALSAAAIARPIFDGFPKPLSGWRNKAAVD